MLAFGCILVATLENVVTMFSQRCFRRRYYNQKVTLLQRCVKSY